MRKNPLFVLFALVTVLAMLAACAPQPAAPVAPAAPEQPAAEQAQPASEQTLEIWYPENRDADRTAFKWLIEQFEKEHPGVKVNVTMTTWEDHFTRIQAAAVAGTMPDLVHSWAPSTGGLYQQGLIIPIDDVVESLGGAETFAEGPLMEVTAADGKIFGLPVYGHLHVLYYRADWFEEAGIEPPDTIEEFVSAAEKLTTGERKGVQLYTRGFDSYYVMDLLTSNGVTPLDAEGNVTINCPETIEVLDAIKTIQDNKWTPDGWTSMNMDDAKLAFMNGSAAMLLNSTSFLNTMASDNPDALEYIKIVPLPIGKGSLRGWAGNSHFAVTSASEKKELAKEFLTFWFRPDIYKEYMAQTVLGFIPLFKPVADDPSFLEMPRIKPVAPFVQEGIKAGAAGGPMFGAEYGPNNVTFQAYNEMTYAQMAEKIYMGETPEAVAAWAETELKRIVSENE